jgi:O-antigen/teichoic acid export membrane protein
MLSPVLWRRSATAIGIYGATGLGIAGMVVAARELGRDEFAAFAIVTSASAFFQLLLDLTVEDALVKFGFRYSTAEDWPRLRRLFDVALRFKLAGGLFAGICLLILAPLSSHVWSTGGLTVPLLLVAALPLLQAPENVYGSAIMLRGRYDIRGYFLLIAMGLRLIGVAIGAHYGVSQAVLGMLVAQVIATAAITWGGHEALRRFPRPEAAPLGSHARELRNFVISSSASSTLVSMRGTLSTLVVGAAAPNAIQAGYFRIAQAPLTAFNALSSPARLVLLTEQTRDFEQGQHDKMYRMLRRYIAGTTVLMALAIPLLWWAMPWLVTTVNGPTYRPAAEPARVLLLAAALQFIFGWTKSFPVSIGRPNLRLWPQIIEIATLVPLTVVFASRWGATGAAVAAVIASAVFASVWCVLLIRIRRERLDVAPASA